MLLCEYMWKYFCCVIFDICIETSMCLVDLYQVSKQYSMFALLGMGVLYLACEESKYLTGILSYLHI